MFLNCASFHVIEIKELLFEKGVFIDMVASLENLTQKSYNENDIGVSQIGNKITC